jgi:hypothetical protein
MLSPHLIIARLCLSMQPGRHGISWPIALFICILPVDQALPQASGLAEIHLIDAQSGQELDCRVQLRGANGVALKPLSSENLGGWSLVKGLLKYRGRPGDYLYEISAGPEYAKVHGGFTLDKNILTEEILRLERHADMAAEGWFAGDLLSCRSTETTLRWMGAEGLAMSSAVRQSIQANAENPVDAEPIEKEADRATAAFGYWDNSPQGGLLIHHWLPPANHPETLPSSRLIAMAKKNPFGSLPVHIEIQRLWARDLPIWLASGKIDSAQLLSDHLSPDTKGASQVKPLVMPEGKYQGGTAAGRLVEQIYWTMLEAGFRIPPTAGSGFGKTSSPLGYNRVYALTGRPDIDHWWRAVREGNTVVTNGPLLRPSINGMPPGYSWASEEPIELDINLVLTSADPVEYVEIIFNGSGLYRAALDEFARAGGKIPVLTIAESGWLVIRVVAKNDQTYRLATSAPFFFEVSGKKRISRAAVNFFQRWLGEAKQQIMLLPPEESTNHLPFLAAAEKFWSQREAQATVP